MRHNRIHMLCVVVLAMLLWLTARAQEVVNEKAFQIKTPAEWIRTGDLPQGFDAGFRKKTAEGGSATLYLHHELMPAEAGGPPSDTSDMERQWDTIVTNQYSDARSVAGTVPQVDGRILINATYELTDNGVKLQRRYTYFLSGRTAFVVQCSAPPAQWASVSKDFETMLSSLHPAGSAGEAQTTTDEAARTDLQRKISVLLGSFPTQWSASLSEVRITPKSGNGKRTVVIGVKFARSDIGEIYNATKIVFDMMKAGKADTDLDGVPAQVRRAADSSGEFLQYTGQVWGLAWGIVASCSPAIERYNIPILGSEDQKVGLLSISREDAAAILAGKVTASDMQRVAGMYVFE